MAETSGTGNEGGANPQINIQVEESNRRPYPKQIRVGTDFQADIPPFNPNQELPEDYGTQIFNPNNITEFELNGYIDEIKQFIRLSRFPEAVDIGKIEERALEILHELRYDTVFAVIMVNSEILESRRRMRERNRVLPNHAGGPNDDNLLKLFRGN